MFSHPVHSPESPYGLILTAQTELTKEDRLSSVSMREPTMSNRRILLYFAWSRPGETSAPLAVIDDRFQSSRSNV
jgi:hypothetical protein